jgi:hypothetical protein
VPAAIDAASTALLMCLERELEVGIMGGCVWVRIGGCCDNDGGGGGRDMTTLKHVGSVPAMR